MMKFKNLLAGILVAAAAVSMAGCGSGSGQSSANPAENGSSGSSEAVPEETGSSGSSEAVPEETGGSGQEQEETESGKVVRFLTPGTTNDGGAMMSENAQIAQINGYFEEELGAIGYSVEYYGFQNQGVGVNEALAAAEGDIAVYGEYPALSYLAGGNDGVIIGMGSSRKQMAILAKDGIESVADLKGKVVGATLGTNSQQYLELELKKNGMSTDDIEIVNASAELTTLFVSGDVDAIVSDAQMIYYVQGLAGTGNVIAVNGDDPELATNFLVVARGAFLDENPDVEAAVLSALKKAQEFASQNPDQVYQLLADSNGTLPVEVFEQYYGFDTTFAFWDPELKEENIETIQKTADYMAETDLLSNAVNVNDFVRK